MEFANYQPRMLTYLIPQRVFATQPFVLFDVGCAGGIDPLWRLFGDQLSGVGFDPQQNEIERLRQNEDNANIKYVPALVGLADSHEFHSYKHQAAHKTDQYFDPLPRSSSAVRWSAGGAVQSNVIGEALTPAKVSISEYARTNRVETIDFIKIDTDGSDLEAAISASEVIRPCNILGFMIESPFTGSHVDTANSFHNIDRFMRQQGFMLYVLAQHVYSRAALPAQFVYNIPASTIFGQVNWADVIYLRDGASSEYKAIWDEELSAVALLKLAALYELFRLPDCAAELIVTHRDSIAALVDPEMLLNRLTPTLNGKQLSYKEYVAAFRDSPEQFFPSAKKAQGFDLWRRISARLRRG